MPNSSGIVERPSFAVGLALLAIVLGLLGSAYQSDIATAFPFRWYGPWAGLSWPAIGFWIALVGLGIGLYFRQRADDSAREDLHQATTRVEKATRTIQTSVQTLPGRDFLFQMSGAIAASRAMLDTYRAAAPDSADSPKSIDISMLLRKLLKMLARLAADYDQRLTDDGATVVYTANVFVAFDSKEVRDWSQVSFAGSTPRERFPQVLSLRADWQTDHVSDPVINPPTNFLLILPVPGEAKDGSKWRALPGAPMTFLTNGSSFYDDTLTLAEWCRREGVYSSKAVDELEQYFRRGRGTEIKSFVSAPLAKGDRRFGVVNIHANATNVLSGDRLHNFLALAAPLLFDVAELIDGLLAAELRESAAGGKLSSGPHHV